MHLDLKSEQCPPPFTCNDIANVVNPFIRREIFAKSRYRPRRSKVRKAKGGTAETKVPLVISTHYILQMIPWGQ